MATFWKIEESIGGGFYFTWEGIFESREGAEKMIARVAAGGKKVNAKPVLYRTGGWNTGAMRAETTE
jgi:hypothetical protein